MAEHDHRVGDAERAGRLDVFEIAAAQEFRAHQPHSDTHENSSNIPSSTKKPGTSTDERIRSRYSEGIALQTSISR